MDFDNYPTTIFKSILTQIYVFLVLFTIFHFDLEKVIIEFGSEFLSKVHPACNNIANGIKPGSDSKKTDKYALCEMYIMLFIQQCGQGILLLDKKAFLFIQEKF